MSERIKAAFWWRSLGRTFDTIAREEIQRAQAAELAETGHECGHQFKITVASTLHTSGPGEHHDADWDGPMKPVTVRAHNLRDALLIAASLPMSDWIDDEEADNE